MDKSLKTLIESLNAQIQTFKENGYRIHDAENLECFIGGIRYDGEDDLIKVDFEEE